MSRPLLNDKIHIIEGNSKLVGTEEKAFLIFNLPTRTTCPFKTARCEEICYAKPEERYPSVRASRNENLVESMKGSFYVDMIDWLEYELDRKKYRGKKLYFRIHSSGDFYNQNYFDQWVKIANFYKGSHRLFFTAYTKSINYLLPYNISNRDINISFLHSVMTDTSEDQLELSKMFNLRSFIALPEKQIKDEFFKCPGECGKCTVCYQKDSNIKNVYIAYHGSMGKHAARLESEIV